MDFYSCQAGAYSKLISSNDGYLITFELLQTRLIKVLTGKINRGDFTERGLARIIGVSQPQMHNVLNGKRTLRPVVADRIMQRFQLDVLSLITDQELRTRLINGSIPPSEFEFEPVLKKGPARENKDRPKRDSRIG